jgi:hypothetical protein
MHHTDSPPPHAIEAQHDRAWNSRSTEVSRRVRAARDQVAHRPRSGARHDDGPICPADRRGTHRMAAFCIAGTLLAVAMMLAHMAGIGLGEPQTLLTAGVGL